MIGMIQTGVNWNVILNWKTAAPVYIVLISRVSALVKIEKEGVLLLGTDVFQNEKTLAFC